MKTLPIKLTSLALITLMVLSACGSTSTSTAVTATEVPATAGSDSSNSVDPSTPTDTNQNPTSAASTEIGAASSFDILETHESESDYTWDEADVVEISLANEASSAAGNGVRVESNQITITASGTYRLTGTLSDGQVLVESMDDGVVQLILNGVDINSNTSAPIYIKESAKTIVILADGTQNTLSDTENYVFASADEDEPKAALFSNDDLTIYGSGSLTVMGRYNDAISTDDGLLISGANIDLQAADDGIRGKNYLVIMDSTVEVDSGGDGLKSNNDDAEELGQIQISNSTLVINSVGDGMSAEGEVAISSGDFTIKSGDSSFNSDSMSAKGIKGLVSVVIDGGMFYIDAMDDAIHSNGDITINGGYFSIASGDDGIHADLALTINGGTIEVTQSYEGLEATVITLNGGDITLVASDDGINAAGGVDGSGMNGGWGNPGGQSPWGQGDQGNGDYWVYFYGSNVYVNAGGDGIDSNGSIEMTGGMVLVDGPTSDGDGPLDYMGTFNISGGTLVAVGSLGMAQAPSTSSQQPSIFLGLNQALSASTLIHLETSSGQSVLTYAPSKQFQSVLISSPDLEIGGNYIVYTGGSSTGEIENHLYLNGQYQSGTELTQLAISSAVTTYGTSAGFGGGGIPGGGGGRRP